jgi:predicted nucleotidyltransferase
MAIELRKMLRKKGIVVDLILLFGSQAKKKSHKDSDIDLAVVSRNYGKDRFIESARLNRLAQKIDCRIEAIPVGLKDYLRKETTSPILHEIIKDGTPLI